MKFESFDEINYIHSARALKKEEKLEESWKVEVLIS